MPFNYDFNNCLNDVKTIDVEPEGWKGPITIEYGVAQKTPYDTQLSVVWRIKGTTHTFAMYERNLNVISHGNYKKHFEEALTNFRKDYLSWFSDDEYKDIMWKYEYKQQYGNLINE